MKKILLLISVVGLTMSLGWTSDLPTAGWTPAQSSEWQGIQVEYAQAVKTYGYHSPQAKSARARKDKMAKLLKANNKRARPAPRVSVSAYNPGTNGTIAPPQFLENVRMVSRE